MAAVLCSGTAFAVDNEIEFHILEQPADRALLDFAQQAGVTLLLPSERFSRIMANRVTGRYPPRAALDLLLKDTDIEAFVDSRSRRLVVKPMEESEETPENTATKNEGEPRGLFGVLGGWLKAMFAGPSNNQAEQGAYSDYAGRVEEITVTGTRIPRLTGMLTSTPVTSTTTDELLFYEPASTLAEQLDALPQFFNTQTAQRGGTTFIDAGASYLNLRGMGPNRALVLLNGSRLVPADSFGNVNVDNLPAALIKSIDVVTGGASAAYGADAIAGVVNFNLDREFTGFSVRTSTGITERGDGENWNVSLAGGGKIGSRLHLAGSLDARHIDEIKPDPGRLDNFKRWGWVTNPDWQPGASPGIPQRITLPYVHPTGVSPQGLIREPGFSLDRYTFTDDGTAVRPYQFGDVFSLRGEGSTYTQSGGPEFDISNQAFDGGPKGREVVHRSVFGSLRYEVNDVLTVFAEALAGRTESNAYGRRGNPALHSIWSGTLFVENPFLPESVRQAMIREGLDSITVSKRGTVYGPAHSNWYADRDDRNISRTSSFTVGFAADFPNTWNLRASWQRGKSKLTSAANNIVRLDKFFTAMDAVVDPATGEIVCNITLHAPTAYELKKSVEGRLFASPLSLEGVEVDSPIGPMNPEDCVPINIFGLGNVSPEARDWVEDAEKKNLRNSTQNFFELIVSRDLHQGLGAGPISFAAGLTYRHESFSQYSLPAFGERNIMNVPELGIRGIPGGFTGPGNRELHQFSGMGAGAGAFHVKEWFTEFNVPILESRAGQYLGVNLAYRQSDYSTSGTIDSWKAGVDLQLFDDLRWRVTRSRDVREPNFTEQFVTGSGGATISDPVMDGNTFLITSFTGPNRLLETEKANTFTTGFVYRPTFAPWIEGLQLSVDWYRIELTEAVARLGAQEIVNDCFYNDGSPLCGLITRNTETNAIDRVVDRYFNVGGALTKGIDFELQYNNSRIDWFDGVAESLGLRAFAGYLEENSMITSSGARLNTVGSREIPQWTANLIADYQVGPISVQWQQRYYDHTFINLDWEEGIDIDDNTIASQSVTNLALSYGRETPGGGEWRFTFHINNLLDREPPVIPNVDPGGGSQAINNNFDTFGRRYQLGFSLQL